MTSSVLLNEELDDATVLLTLNRPDKRNALTVELMDALRHELDVLARQSGRRIVVLRGAGAAFSAGLDLVEAAEPDMAELSAESVARTFEALLTSPLVCIAAAHGAAFAGGAGLLACCDFVVAAEDLRIGFPEVRRGLVPALVGTVLRDRLRDRDLRELLLLAEPIDARRALAVGLVQRVVAGDSLLNEARSLATAILKGAPEAVRQTKQLLRKVCNSDPSQPFAQAMAIHKVARQSGEAREGLLAFKERREPDWNRAQ